MLNVIETVVCFQRGKQVGEEKVGKRIHIGDDEWRVFFEGAPMPHREETLAAIQEISGRCIPWVTVYVGPSTWSVTQPNTDYSCRSTVRKLRDGRVAYEHRGVSNNGGHAIGLSGKDTLPSTLGYLHHEIWHEVDRPDCLCQEDIAVVEAGAARGIRKPGEYLDSPRERRARAYQYWASARDEGWQPPSIGGMPISRLDRVFEYVYSGQLARCVSEQGQIKSVSLFPCERFARDAMDLARSPQGVFTMAMVGLLTYLGQ